MPDVCHVPGHGAQKGVHGGQAGELGGAGRGAPVARLRGSWRACWAWCGAMWEGVLGRRACWAAWSEVGRVREGEVFFLNITIIIV